MDRKFLVLGWGVIGILLIAIAAVAVFSSKERTASVKEALIETPSRIGRAVSSLRRRSPVSSADGQYVKRGVITPTFARAAARSILEWMNSQRIYGVRLSNPSQYGEFVVDGGYSTGTFCTEQKKCTTTNVANNMGLIATWANYQYFKLVDRDKDIMSIMDRDIRIYEDSKKISAIQPISTNFKHMYELWSEGEFSDEQKERIKNVLYRMQHDPSLIDPIEKTIKESGNIPSPAAVTTVRSYSDIQDFGVDSKADLYAVLSSEYAYTYLYVKETGDDIDYAKYLYTAIGLFNESLTKHNNPYYVGIAALDLYKTTGELFYLKQAEAIASLTDAYACDTIDRCAPRIYFLHKLGKLSGNQTYTRKRNELLTPVITERYDADGLGGYRFGYNAFYSDKPYLQERYRYDLDANALLVAVLVDL